VKCEKQMLQLVTSDKKICDAFIVQIFDKVFQRKAGEMFLADVVKIKTIDQ